MLPQVGGEKGSVLIWDVSRNCLLYDIPAHDGKVFDCGWSGDSRRLLSVGSDGRARLWDAAAGSELCQVGDKLSTERLLVVRTWPARTWGWSGDFTGL